MDAVIILSAHGDAVGDPGAIGWAWIDHTDGHFDSGGAATGTENSAGLTAVLRAIEAHPGSEPLLVESGSQQAIRVAAEWLPTWKKNGWRTSAGDVVPDADLVRALDDAVTARTGPVRFRHVRGHIDNPLHARARRLAELSAAEWSAGRGRLDGFLIGDMPPADGGTAATPGGVSPASPAAAGAEQRQGSPASWESATLF